MALTSATKVIRSSLKTFQPVAIPFTTMAITSASHKSGHSICHNKQIHQLSHMWPPAALGITSAHTNGVIPSTTMATTSANSHCGYNICHSQKISPIIQMWLSSSTNKQKWLLHLPQWQNTSAIIQPHGK